MKRFGWLGIIGIIVIIVIWVMGAYNGMVTDEQNVENAWGNVESQYQRRADLVQNLVNTVKGSADFEKSTLTDVINARARATQVTVDPSKLNSESIAQFQQAQDGLSSALGRLLVSVERYPELKTTEAFQKLQDQLEGIENRINFARDKYNEAVKVYNIRIKRAPANFFANAFGFEEKGYFESQEGADVAPTVDFGTESK